MSPPFIPPAARYPDTIPHMARQAQRLGYPDPSPGNHAAPARGGGEGLGLCPSGPIPSPSGPEAIAQSGFCVVVQVPSGSWLAGKRSRSIQRRIVQRVRPNMAPIASRPTMTGGVFMLWWSVLRGHGIGIAVHGAGLVESLRAPYSAATPSRALGHVRRPPRAPRGS